MNYLQEMVEKILKDYGLETEQAFELRYVDNNTQRPGLFRFNKNYFLEEQCYDEDDDDKYWRSSWGLAQSVFNGTLKIYPLPFRPKDNETYYYVYWVSWECNPVVAYTRWIGNDEDYMRLRFGNVFRTEEQAMAARDTVHRKIVGETK